MMQILFPIYAVFLGVRSTGGEVRYTLVNFYISSVNENMLFFRAVISPFVSMWLSFSVQNDKQIWCM